MSESGGFFQILTFNIWYDNYKETNGIKLEFFNKGPVLLLGTLQHFKELSIIHFKDHSLEFKSWKKILKNLELFSIFKCKFE